MGIFKNLFKKQDNNSKYYTPEEIEELTDFIEKTYGQLVTIAHERVSDDFHIDLIIIPPHENADYYTISSMGHGAQEFKGIGNSVGRQEFVLYLPNKWNVMDEGFNLPENWWPISMLKFLCRQEEYYGIAELLDFCVPYADCTQSTAAFIAPSLSNFYGYTEVNLSSGKHIEFFQMIPISASDVEICDNAKSDIERVSKVLNLNMTQLENENIPEETIISNIISHFKQMINK